MCGGPQWKREVVPDHKVRGVCKRQQEATADQHLLSSLTL